jgi:hypothetical protein
LPTGIRVSALDALFPRIEHVADAAPAEADAG